MSQPQEVGPGGPARGHTNHCATWPLKSTLLSKSVNGKVMVGAGSDSPLRPSLRQAPPHRPCSPIPPGPAHTHPLSGCGAPVVAPEWKPA